MNPFNFNRDPENFARLFSQYVRAIVWTLMWAIIAMATIAASYVAVRGIWVAARFVSKAIGI